MLDALRPAIAALLFACGSAHAAIVGTLSNLYEQDLSLGGFAKTSTVPGLSGPFTAAEPLGLAFLDRLSFSIDAASVVTLRGEVTDGLANVSMFELLAPAGILVSSPSAGVIVAEGLLGPDDYLAVLSGDVFGGATYRFVAFAVAAIPEPGTLALLVAGLACFGAVVARRIRETQQNPGIPRAPTSEGAQNHVLRTLPSDGRRGGAAGPA
jgi:hypothetical protein